MEFKKLGLFVLLLFHLHLLPVYSGKNPSHADEARSLELSSPAAVKVAVGGHGGGGGGHGGGHSGSSGMHGGNGGDHSNTEGGAALIPLYAAGAMNHRGNYNHHHDKLSSLELSNGVAVKVSVGGGNAGRHNGSLEMHGNKLRDNRNYLRTQGGAAAATPLYTTGAMSRHGYTYYYHHRRNTTSAAIRNYFCCHQYLLFAISSALICC